MTTTAVIGALALPAETHIDQRVPKKLLIEQGALTGSDRRLVQDGIDNLVWAAALKPTSIGVPAYQQESREYLEIAVLILTLRPDAKTSRLAELVHRTIPYPVVLVTVQGNVVELSLAHKRTALNDADKTVLEALHRTHWFQPANARSEEAAFLASMAMSSLPNQDLFHLYQGWIDRVAGLAAAGISGHFGIPQTPESSAALQADLEAHAALQRELTTLRAQAKREKQMNRLVDLNLKIKRLELELTATGQRLETRTSGVTVPDSRQTSA